jgi:hypothetical protein
MGSVNLLAVFVAAIASYLVGALWYLPRIFGAQWMVENGKTRESMRITGANLPLMNGVALLAALISSYALARLLITPDYHSLEIGLKRGFGVGTCIVAMSFASSYAFEQRSARHWAINAGCFVLQFSVMGMVLGVLNG